VVCSNGVARRRPAVGDTPKMYLELYVYTQNQKHKSNKKQHNKTRNCKHSTRTNTEKITTKTKKTGVKIVKRDRERFT